MNKMKLSILGSIALSTSLLGVILTEGKSQAAVIITATEDVLGVTFSTSGTLDISGLTFVRETLAGGGINPNIGVINFANRRTALDQYDAIVSGPIEFGSIRSFTNSSTLSGSPFFLQGFSNRIAVPTGFTSGPLSGELFFSEATFESLGVTTGTYVWNLANDETITLNISDPMVVPEPLTILGTGAAIAFGTGFKRKLIKAKKK